MKKSGKVENQNQKSPEKLKKIRNNLEKMEKDQEKFEKIGIENHEKSGKVAYLPILSG